MNETTRNWNEEKKHVDEAGNKNWFKPESEVSYQVLFLDEGGVDYQREFEDRVLTQVDFHVKVTGGGLVGVDHVWTLTKGGPDSLFGKLVDKFVKGGQAKGCVVEVTAVGSGKNRRYLVR